MEREKKRKTKWVSVPYWGFIDYLVRKRMPRQIE
jgi:hypothetical protein